VLFAAIKIKLKIQTCKLAKAIKRIIPILLSQKILKIISFIRNYELISRMILCQLDEFEF